MSRLLLLVLRIKLNQKIINSDQPLITISSRSTISRSSSTSPYSLSYNNIQTSSSTSSIEQQQQQSTITQQPSIENHQIVLNKYLSSSTSNIVDDSNFEIKNENELFFENISKG